MVLVVGGLCEYDEPAPDAGSGLDRVGWRAGCSALSQLALTAADWLLRGQTHSHHLAQRAVRSVAQSPV